MLKRSLIIFVSVIIGACTPMPDLAKEQHVEATYRLLFNDVLVGHALFELMIDADGKYRIEAFTTPADQIRKVADHEVLEMSHGTINADGIRPAHYDHSVREQGQLNLVNLEFDWQKHTLQLANQDKTHRVGLLPGTHDRLSYLLAASILADAEHGRLPIRVASTDATEEGMLEVIGQADIDVPQGQYRAIGVRRATSDKDDRRELWFDTKVTPLPLLLVHRSEGNAVEMQLESIKTGRQPPPE